MSVIAEPFPAIDHLSTECDKDALRVHISGKFDSVYIYISCNNLENEVGLNRQALFVMCTFVISSVELHMLG